MTSPISGPFAAKDSPFPGPIGEDTPFTGTFVQKLPHSGPSFQDRLLQNGMANPQKTYTPALTDNKQN